MSTIVGNVELDRDFEKFVHEHFQRVRCCPTIKKCEGSTVSPLRDADSTFKLASVLDIIDTHIFKKVEEKAKLPMILACKSWAHRLLPIQYNYSKLIQLYTDSLYDEERIIEGVKFMVIKRESHDLFVFPILSSTYSVSYEILNPEEGEFNDYVDHVLSMYDQPAKDMEDID